MGISIRRPSSRALLCLGVIIGFAAPCALAVAQGEGLPNGGFEQLDPETAAPAGWTAWATPNYAVYTLAAARSGVSCVAITDDDPKVSQGLRSPRLPVEAGKTYRASAWLLIERLEAGGFALYLEYWQGNERIENKSTYAEEAPEWKQLALAYPAPEGATHATLLLYGSSATVGRAYFDDASLTEAPGQ